MKNELKSETAEQIIKMDQYSVDSNTPDNNHNGKTSDTHPYDNDSEAKLTIFGHAFTISELYAISKFINQLQSTSTKLLNPDQSIPSGSVFIMKVINHEIDVSFGGFLKK